MSRPAISPRSRTPRANSSTSASPSARLQDDEDMAWAKPLVDEARDAVKRGEFVSLDEHKAGYRGASQVSQGVMSRLIVSLKARADTSDIIKDLANKAGYGVAAAYAASFAGVNERLAEFPDSGARHPSLGRESAFVWFRHCTSSFTNTWKPTTLSWFCASFTDVAKSDENS